jgi:hypothetical protein
MIVLQDEYWTLSARMLPLCQALLVMAVWAAPEAHDSV